VIKTSALEPQQLLPSLSCLFCLHLKLYIWGCNLDFPTAIDLGFELKEWL